MRLKFFVFILIFLFICSSISAKNNSDEINLLVGISDKGVQYDKELITQFLLSEWVHVTIKIQDNTNINFSKDDSDNQFRDKLDERTILLNATTNSILYSLSNDEFQLERVFPLGNGFYGNITKEGFGKLLKDERIKKIYAQKLINLSGRVIIKSFSIYILPPFLLLVLIIVLIKYKKEIWKRKNS